MQIKKYKPLLDKLFYISTVIALLILAAMTVSVCLFPAAVAIVIVALVDLLTVYVIFSPLFGYVELREETLFIKYGLILKKEIPYEKIRSAEKTRHWYSESILALKNAITHVNVRYNAFDVTTVSVKDNDGFIEELQKRISEK